MITTGVILFTDIKASSKLWKKFPDRMFDALKIHDRLIQAMIEQNKGTVIKTIGDSFMAHFKKECDAIRASVAIQSYLGTSPITIGDTKLRIRIGIALGELYMKRNHIQNCELVDYFGNTVNTAARLESKVSPIGGFAIAMTGSLTNYKKCIGRDYKVKVINYKGKCRPMSKTTRFINSINSECRLINELKGVSPVKVLIAEYKIN